MSATCRCQRCRHKKGHDRPHVGPTCRRHVADVSTCCHFGIILPTRHKRHFQLRSMMGLDSLFPHSCPRKRLWESRQWMDSSRFFRTFFHSFVLMVDGVEDKEVKIMKGGNDAVWCWFWLTTPSKDTFLCWEGQLKFSVLIPCWMKNGDVKKRDYMFCVEQ